MIQPVRASGAVVLPRFASAALLGLAIAACSGEQEKPAASHAPVIIISIDTLRADRLPAYGYKEVETPAIDALRRDAILFRTAYSPCPITLPAHLSMLTGLLPHEHGVRVNAGYRWEPAGRPSLPELLKQSGYATGASVSSWILRGETGMAAMFDDYDDEILLGSGSGLGENERPGSVAASYGTEWINGKGDTPFFFLLHLYEPHAPYEPPEPYRSRYPHAYDGEIAATDAIVGRFLDELRRIGVYDRALIVLTSDHGEGLMDHGEDQHGILLYREAIHVPLLIKLPRSERRGQTSDVPVQLSDLPATILETVTGATQIAGVNILSGNAAPRRRIYSETFYPRIHLGWSELRSLTDGRYQYIEAPRPELYDIHDDPAQEHDVISTERRIAASMRNELAAIPKNLEKIGEVSGEAAARLRSLGYLAAPATTGDVLPNPNEKAENLAAIKRGFFLAEDGQWQEAEKELRQVVRANPGMIEAALKLGEVLTELRRYPEAIAVYESTLRTTPRFSPDLALSLAVTQLRAGALADAATSARLAADSEPERAHEILARIAVQRGNFPDAEMHARAAADSRQPKLMLVEAEVAIAKGDYARALRVIDAAEARNRELGGSALFRANFLRGDAYARMSRIAESEAAYRREIEAFPSHLQAWGNLAVVHALTGRDYGDLLEDMKRKNPSAAARDFAQRVAGSLQADGL